MAIWHDIAPEGRAAFYDWHGNEHMAERVAIPGFLRGRRYVAVSREVADLEFFNLYEASALSVLKGADYQARLDDPTPWTVETVKHFRKVNRALCEVAHSQGVGGAGLIATLRYDGSGAGDDAVEELVRPLAGAPGVAGVHLLRADEAASSADSAERAVREETNIVPSRAILVESWGDEDALRNLCSERLSDAALEGCGVTGPVGRGIYRLQLTLPND